MSQTIDIYSFKKSLFPQPQYGGRLGILICGDEMMSRESIRRVHGNFMSVFSDLKGMGVTYSETISAGDELIFFGSGQAPQRVDNRRRNMFLLLFMTSSIFPPRAEGLDASGDILEILLERYRPEMDGRNEVRVV